MGNLDDVSFRCCRGVFHHHRTVPVEIDFRRKDDEDDFDLVYPDYRYQHLLSSSYGWGISFIVHVLLLVVKAASYSNSYKLRYSHRYPVYQSVQ